MQYKTWSPSRRLLALLALLPLTVLILGTLLLVSPQRGPFYRECVIVGKAEPRPWRCMVLETSS